MTPIRDNAKCITVDQQVVLKVVCEAPILVYTQV